MIAVDFRSGQFAATTWRLLYASELRFSCDWTVINLILMWLSCDHIYVYCDGAATVLKTTAIELRLFWRLLRLNCDYFRGYCDWTAIIFEATAIELRLFSRLLRLSCDYFESYCDWAAIILEATAIELWLFWKLLRLSCDCFKMIVSTIERYFLKLFFTNRYHKLSYVEQRLNLHHQATLGFMLY